MKHIPNLLSIFRILLIPFFVWQMIEGNTLAAGIILAVSGLTDLLDGKLARHFGWVSDIGKVLDPIADKLTQTAVCITLLVLSRDYWPFFVILLAKDFIMLVLGGYLLKKDVKLEGAKIFGKVSTTVFYAAMILIVLIPSMPHWLILTLLILATTLAILAFLSYIPEFFRYRDSIEPKKKSS